MPLSAPELWHRGEVREVDSDDDDDNGVRVFGTYGDTHRRNQLTNKHNIDFKDAGRCVCPCAANVVRLLCVVCSRVGVLHSWLVDR